MNNLTIYEKRKKVYHREKAELLFSSRFVSTVTITLSCLAMTGYHTVCINHPQEGKEYTLKVLDNH
ncbi:MAG: hypothetical protein ACQZ3N_01170 [cyanobacterium endosymbiont of Rhopalodia yunnanensis]